LEENQTNYGATRSVRFGLKAIDVVEKDFWGISAQHSLKMKLENATSIQKGHSDDSIVAFQQDVADFFDSIDPKQTSGRVSSCKHRTHNC
jgi:hypothetical protein